MNPFLSFPMLRRLAWRCGRRLYALARGEGPNDPRSNGEYWLQRAVIDMGGAQVTLLDVGANKGEWTLNALENAPSSREVRIHAFEPSSATRQILSRRCRAHANAVIHGQALSDREGRGVFYSREAGGGTNSLAPVSGDDAEQVELITCDAFLRKRGLDHVDMLKIDTEGFDLLVMRGAKQCLSEGRFDVVQFEYNWRWLLNNACLRDVFELVAERPYRVGKLVGSTIEFYDEWHFELDRFFENNYVLVRKGSDIEKIGRSVRFDQSNVAVLAANP